MHPPEFFQAIRDNAARRWDQLDADPELAAPWHQLFRQVQSPRHVLSELLQNADDAGATAAAVRVEDSRFIFTHDGEDFAPDHFNSICRFGCSIKRSLHTIGFRGIGFKSAFSLGDQVKLRTPNLSVIFHTRRFTEPIWDDTVDIDVEDWRMIEAHPETHSMILADHDGDPIEVAGSSKLKDRGVLKLYQTHFRLVCEDIPQSFNLLRPQAKG
jgi:Histidine kinase-, DNA gyrase B-, and HSP90-like ATPase